MYLHFSTFHHNVLLHFEILYEARVHTRTHARMHVCTMIHAPNKTKGVVHYFFFLSGLSITGLQY